LVEVIFELPGLGQTLVYSAVGEPPAGEAILLVAAIVAVGLSLAVDLVAGALLPDWRVDKASRAWLAMAVRD
jgi:ABC-type dipeptide/oligopeptide/nickel transport system permease component